MYCPCNHFLFQGLLVLVEKYSCVKMIFNNKNEVIDYEIIDKNDEFDKLIDIINKNIWIGYLKKVNIHFCKNMNVIGESLTCAFFKIFDFFSFVSLIN